MSVNFFIFLLNFSRTTWFLCESERVEAFCQGGVHVSTLDLPILMLQITMLNFLDHLQILVEV